MFLLSHLPDQTRLNSLVRLGLPDDRLHLAAGVRGGGGDRGARPQEAVHLPALHQLPHRRRRATLPLPSHTDTGVSGVKFASVVGGVLQSKIFKGALNCAKCVILS